MKLVPTGHSLSRSFEWRVIGRVEGPHRNHEETARMSWHSVELVPMLEALLTPRLFQLRRDYSTHSTSSPSVCCAGRAAYPLPIRLPSSAREAARCRSRCNESFAGFVGVETALCSMEPHGGGGPRFFSIRRARALCKGKWVVTSWRSRGAAVVP